MSEFDDNRQFYGNAFTLYHNAQTFMMDHLPIASHFVPGQFERVDEPLYPTAALREALANALCHRDYLMGGGSIGVGIYDDRLEITSTGSVAAWSDARAAIHAAPVPTVEPANRRCLLSQGNHREVGQRHPQNG